MTARVTTVIPAFNADSFVCEAIDSVLAQSVASQIIVVNDGSTDGTRKSLSGYGDAIRVIDQPNQGLSAARNAGIASATTSLVALLDADDVWLPGKLERQLALFDSQRDLALVHSQTCRWKASTNTRDEFVSADQSLYQHDCFARLFVQNAICVSSVMFRRDAVEELGLFDEQIRRPTTQDHDLWLRISHRHRIGFVDELSVLYRCHENNASGDVIGMLEDRAYVLKKAIGYGSDKLNRALGERHVWSGFAHTCYLAGYQHFQRGNVDESKLWLRRAYRHGRRNLRSFCGAVLPSMLLRLAYHRQLSK